MNVLLSKGAAGERPRVLHVMDNLGVGGMELGVLRLIERTRDRFEHSICCVRDPAAREHLFGAAGAAVTFAGKGEGRDWGLPWRMARVCRALQPHIVHTRNWGTIEAVLAARLSRVPVVIHGEHGRDVGHRQAPEHRRDRIRRLLFPFVDRIVVVSEHLRRWLLDEIGVRAEKAALIPNGVDTDRFRPGERERRRREHGYDPQDVLIGAVGRLHSVKDYPTLIGAFEKVLHRQPEVRLVIVGDGPERERLAGDIRRRGLQVVARLAGHQDDVCGWLAAMDVFVQASVMEGTSNAILEAMSVGLPVVATRVGGTPEVVQEGGTGRLVEAGNAAPMAEALAFYAQSPGARREHGRAGRERVIQHYPVGRMVGAYADLYADAVERSRVRAGAGS